MTNTRSKLTQASFHLALAVLLFLLIALEQDKWMAATLGFFSGGLLACSVNAFFEYLKGTSDD